MKELEWGSGVLKIEESESEVLKIEESESGSELLCTDPTALLFTYCLMFRNSLRQSGAVHFTNMLCPLVLVVDFSQNCLCFKTFLRNFGF
jgi:hypothetical protein